MDKIQKLIIRKIYKFVNKNHHIQKTVSINAAVRLIIKRAKYNQQIANIYFGIALADELTKYAKGLAKRKQLIIKP